MLPAPAGSRKAHIPMLDARIITVTELVVRKSFVDVEPRGVPLALADLHRTLAVGTRVALRLPTEFDQPRTTDVLAGGGFVDVARSGSDLLATRARTLPDYVAARMRVLFAGLNPSLYAADAGVGFARPGNRFWPAALAAGVLTIDRDPRDALTSHHAGFTDLVKRATPRADALSRDEYHDGAARVARLVSWLRPAVVCVVGLSGWRSAIDRHAAVGWQLDPFAGRPVYVMPNTSGVNARVPLDAFVEHLSAAFSRAGGHTR
jgi:TDG/mug DNA glycosylase family protein